MQGGDPTFHRIWNKLAALRTNLEVLEEVVGPIQTAYQWACTQLLGTSPASSVDLERARELLLSNQPFIREDLHALVRESLTALEQLNEELGVIEKMTPKKG